MGGAGPGSRRPGRPLTRAATLGMAAHVFYELASGVGMPMASVVGPVPAAAAWSTGTAAVLRAGTGDRSHDRLFASLNGFYLSAVLGHYAAWPWTRPGLPWLADCEGLGPERMPVYNAILYLSGGAALAGLLLENPDGRARAAVLPVALVPVLVLVQRREFRRLQELAWRRPGWWNRRLRRVAPAG
jgi:hypothetical protein